MSMDVWDEDTLFLVFEEDYRFRPSEGRGPVLQRFGPEWAADRAVAAPEAATSGSEQRGTPVAREVPAAAAGEPTATAARSGRAAVFEEDTKWYQAPTRPPKEAYELATMSQDLLNIVCYATQAFRAEQSHIQWLCWQPGDAGTTKRTSPSFGPCKIRSGTMLVSLDVFAARVLFEATLREEWPRGRHWDLAFKDWMAHAGKTHPVNARYMVPPLGNYYCHPSAFDARCGPGTAGRLSCWGEPWCCPGTSRAEDPQGRSKQWYSMTDKAGAVAASYIMDPDVTAHAWKSYWAVEGVPHPRGLNRALRRLPGEAQMAYQEAAASPAATAVYATVPPPPGEPSATGAAAAAAATTMTDLVLPLPASAATAAGHSVGLATPGTTPVAKIMKNRKSRAARERRGAMVHASLRVYVEDPAEVGGLPGRLVQGVVRTLPVSPASHIDARDAARVSVRARGAGCR